MAAHKWHETEFDGQQIEEHKAVISSVQSDPNVVGIIIGTLCVAVVICAAAAGILAARYIRRKRDSKSGSHLFTTRGRLFSHDRLDTTEYMNSLATLDRKLAMDEILEKRKQAILDNELICDTNPGIDDLYIDLTASPNKQEQTLCLLTQAEPT